MENKAKYTIGQRVKIIRKLNDCGDDKFPEFNKYIGKFGIVTQSHKIGFGGISGTKKVELPDSIYVYTVKIDNSDLDLPEDMLQALNW
jgi:hypothetical protein